MSESACKRKSLIVKLFLEVRRWRGEKIIINNNNKLPTGVLWLLTSVIMSLKEQGHILARSSWLLLKPQLETATRGTFTHHWLVSHLKPYLDAGVGRERPSYSNSHPSCYLSRLLQHTNRVAFKDHWEATVGTKSSAWYLHIIPIIE